MTNISALPAAALAALLVLAPALAAPPSPEARYQAALKVLKKDCSEVCGLGGYNPTEMKALDALWDATEDWTLAFLNAHPSITAEQLKSELLNRHPRDIGAESIAPGWVTLLAHDLYAFSANWGETGDVFLVGRRDGQWAVVWDVRNAETGRFAALQAWRSDHAGPGCPDGRYGCGPLLGSVFALKPDAHGRVRFGLGGTYAQEVGFTFAKQISFWRWDGTKAEPLVAQTFEQYIEDQEASVPDTPGRVVVRAKEDYKTIDVCCAGRQLDWTFRILPDRIVDEGKKPLYPEADFIDEIYGRLKEHRPVSGSGTPQALALMAEKFPEGMGDFATRRDQAGATVCLSADSFETIFLSFRLGRRASGYFIAKAERLPKDDFDKLCYPAAK